ncbi:hypothetical protein [Paenibacillus graminis]|uniref:hypothetical protein n=1 Tax=Paenibacillus graminis TaxID=189425 RepID=UPI002DBF15A7|nr:hypothetical protein [Paenibacillus graminis]MEC0169118.1 hypothetical protein [Paenibacillus graminis]
MIQPSISKLLKNEMKEILHGQQLLELTNQIDNLTLENKKNPSQQYTIYLRCKNFEWQSVLNNYQIKLDSSKLSKVFKVSAQNQRYKTTALLIIAILLGYYIDDNENLMLSNLSLQDKRDILNNDRLLQRMENLKNSIFNLDEIERSELHNRHITLEIKSVDQDILDVNIDHKEIKIKSCILEKEVILNLSGDRTYDSYLRTISDLSLFTPNLISKGRNFVKYILVEESKKYWHSLESIIERLKSLQIKWYEAGPKKTKDQVQSVITALKFLITAKSKYSEYFAVRIEYLRYLELKKRIVEIPDSEMFRQKNEQLVHFEELCSSLQLEIDPILDSISKISKIDYLGNQKERYLFFDEILNKTTIPTLNLKTDVEFGGTNSIRQFRVLVEENGKINETLIRSYKDFIDVFEKIDKLQNEFFNATQYFNNHKETLESKIRLLNESQIQFFSLKKELESLSTNFRIIDEFKKLEDYLSPYLSKLNEIPSFHVDLIERNISNANINDFRNLEKELERANKLLDSESFDNIKLSFLLNSLIEAYEIFGKEVSSMSRGDNLTNPSLLVENNLLNKLIEIFEEDIVKRCKYYFKSTSDGVKAFKTKTYDFRKRLFYSEENDILDLQNGLSGGTDSAMTVYSLASANNETLLGNVLLVDEWGDVSMSFHKKVLEKLKDLDTFAFALFVDVDDRYDEIKTISEGEEN